MGIKLSAAPPAWNSGTCQDRWQISLHPESTVTVQGCSASHVQAASSGEDPQLPVLALCFAWHCVLCICPFV